MEYYSAIKKEILTFVATWMDLESIMLSEISQTEKDKYSLISLIMWNLKKYKLVNVTKSRLTDTENKLGITSEERAGVEGQDRGRGLRGKNYYV